MPVRLSDSPFRRRFDLGEIDLRSAKLSALFLTFSFLSACSTLSGEREASAPAEDAYSDVRTIEMQTKVARLQTENARLANRVLELQRENASLRKSGDAAAQAEELQKEASKTPPVTAVALREPETAPKTVVDNPEAPEMAKSEVPVAPAPRLTQPTFTSTDTVFENEAENPASTRLYGVHLASYRQPAEAREGWRKLQRENPDELGLLEPRLESVEVPEKGFFLRLIGGGLSSQEKADALCANLKSKGLFCSVSEFSGERLSLTETG